MTSPTFADRINDRVPIGAIIPPSRRSLGFTLIELLLVMALIMTLAAIATPALNRTVQARALRSSAVELAQLAEFAREEAIRQKLNIEMRFDDDGASYSFRIQDREHSLEEKFEQIKDALLGSEHILPQHVTVAARNANSNATNDQTLERVLFLAGGVNEPCEIRLTGMDDAKARVRLGKYPEDVEVKFGEE
jgi:type II secretion system protein H